MKRFVLLICLLLLIAPALLFSESIEPWKAADGDWRMIGGRLTQLDTKAGMAQAYMYLRQTGVVQYEFNVKFIDGGQDEYAGFGIHIAIDKPHVRKSWGNGKSFLLWLTYDPAAYGGWGVYAQAYKSFRHSYMEMLHKGDRYAVPGQYLKGIDLRRLSQYVLPVKIVIDYDTGWVKVYDPARSNYYYKSWLGQPLRGGLYIALRTNSLAGSFGNFRIKQLQ